MNKEIKTVLKKTAKIAGVTCVAAGAVAIVTSKAALQAMLKGGEYLKDAVKKIIDEEPNAEEVTEEPVAESAKEASVVETSTEETVAEETAAEAEAEAPAEEEPQEA